MSKEAVRAFHEKVLTDAKLQEKLKAIPTSDRHSAMAAAVQIAAEIGFEFTVEEAEAVMGAAPAPDPEVSQTLTDSMLGDVAGGGMDGFSNIFEERR